MKNYLPKNQLEHMRTSAVFTGVGIIVIATAVIFTVSYLNSAKNVKNVSGTKTDVPNTQIEPESQTSSPEAKVINRKFDHAPETLPDSQLKNRVITIATNKGNIVIDLFGGEAPKTVSNFIFLTGQHYYDGLTFHRREEGFVIQGGDPAGNGTGGPGYNFADEPVVRKYTRGIVAMANAGPNTNGSQFFIMLSDNPLPPNYTIFGQVISGMDAVDRIQIGDKMNTVTVK